MQVPNLGNVRRILVLNRNHIGDCLLTTPLFRALKRRFPRAHLAVAIPEENKDLLVQNPHIDEIVVRPELSRWGAKFRFAFEMRSREYDLIISLQEKSMFYAWATWYAAFGRRDRSVTVALEHPRTRRWYDFRVPIEEDHHEVWKYLAVAELLDCPRERNPVLELEPSREARESVNQLLDVLGVDKDVRFIGINPGGSKSNKRWPEERFAEVGERLHRELGLPIMVFGGHVDRDRAHRIADLMKCPATVVAGQASLGQTAALLEHCQLLVTGDTGPMHMAVALAVPVVAMFGPTNPNKFGPFTTLKTVIRHDRPCTECVNQAAKEGRSGVWNRLRAFGRILSAALRGGGVEAVPPCLHTISPTECTDAALGLFSAPPFRRVPMDHR